MFYPYSGFKLGPDLLWSEPATSFAPVPLGEQKAYEILANAPTRPDFASAIVSQDPISIQLSGNLNQLNTVNPDEATVTGSSFPFVALGALALLLFSK